MKIILICPYEEVSPLGILNLATFLEEKGHQAFSLFLPLVRSETPAETEQVLGLIEELEPGIVGFSLMAAHYIRSAKMAGEVKQRFPRLPVVWGGVHPTLAPEECIAHADMILRGEGEEPLLELLNRMEKGDPCHDILNLWIKKDGDRIENPLRPLQENLDLFPFPRFNPERTYILSRGKIHQFSKKIYQDSVWRGGQIYDIMVTRGCPHSCTYCCNSAFRKLYRGKYLRSRSIEHVISELQYVKEQFGFVKSFKIQDDSFLINRSDDWLKSFCSQYRKKVGLNLMANLSPGQISEKRIELLREAGLTYVQMGLEGSDRVNREVFRRAIRKDVFLKASSTLNKYGIAAHYDVIMDNPYADDDDILEMIDTLLKVRGVFSLRVFSLTFYHNTELYHRAVADRLIKSNSDPYQVGAYYMVEPTYLNKLMLSVPCTPGFLVRWFAKKRSSRPAGLLLRAYYLVYVIPFFKLLRLLSGKIKVFNLLVKAHYIMNHIIGFKKDNSSATKSRSHKGLK